MYAYALFSYLDEVIKKHLVRRIFAASFNFLPYLDYTPTPEGCSRGDLITIILSLDHVSMRPEINSNRFEISNRFEMFRLHGSLHVDFTVATFQKIARPITKTIAHVQMISFN